ncbi:MAG: hypothetical protein GX591_19510 [Planctomycetes bacterium]|nr:hypothetical protein [Planctomycetota bacterium]
MTDSQAKSEAGERHICPMCGGDIDFSSPIVRATQNRIRFVMVMIPIGVIVLAGGKLLAAFTTLDSVGYVIAGFGAAVALLSAFYVKSLTY